MQVLLRRSKTFHAFVVTQAAEGDRPGLTAERSHTVGASTEPMELPDWCRDTPTYQMGIQDGSIIELRPVHVPPMAKPVVPPPPGLEQVPAKDEAPKDALAAPVIVDEDDAPPAKQGKGRR